jgi:hypothetical protein
MSSLADLPDLVGFFSYSRDDDEGSKGGLSALRDAIQTELSAQLGRSRADFRVWQDKAAISLGTLWEKQISQGINQSVFFIPIVTPRALRSQNCGLEFQSFLAREAELGRDDLVFPILYIPVPALEDEKLWRQDPVLNIVGTRQYLDWRELRHHEPHSTEVRQKIERYCRNIANALHKPWVSPEERQRREEEESRRRSEEELQRGAAQLEAERQAKEERRRQEVEAARRAEEEQRARIAEEEARQRAAEERRRQKAADEQRVQQERAFSAAKRSNSVAAIEAFLAAHPESHFAGEAQQLKSALRAREEAFGRAMASDDAAVLRSFRDVYKKGADVDQARARLRLLEPPQKWQPSKPAIISGALAIVLVGAVIGWFEMRPGSNIQQISAATSPPSVPVVAASTVAVPVAPPVVPAATNSPPAEMKAKISDVAPSVVPAAPKSPEVPPEAVSKPAPPPVAPPRPDELAWSLLKDTSDAASLQRFTAQFPDSPLRKDAETRIAALTAAQDAALKASTANQPDPHELARSLQFELTRVGCFNGTVSGVFDDSTKAAWRRFIKLTSIAMPDDVSSDAINAVRGINKRVCPLVCPHGEHAEGEQCIANAPPPPPKHVATKPAPDRPAPAAAPASNPYCQGRASGVAVSSGANNCSN